MFVLALSQSCLKFQKFQCNMDTLLICDMVRNVQAKITVQTRIVLWFLVQGSRYFKVPKVYLNYFYR